MLLNVDGLIVNFLGFQLALDLQAKTNVLISRIQNIRKSSGFDVTDKIEVKIKNHPKLLSPINNNKNYILSEILGTKLYFSDDFDKNDETVEFDEIKTIINLRKV